MLRNDDHRCNEASSMSIIYTTIPIIVCSILYWRGTRGERSTDAGGYLVGAAGDMLRWSRHLHLEGGRLTGENTDTTTEALIS